MVALGRMTVEVSLLRPHSSDGDVGALLEEIDRDQTSIFWG
jgi:hypothetical protein